VIHGEGTRERIVRASADLFAKQGYHGTGLNQLLAATGLGKGGFYHHITSKEDLLLEIMLDPINRALPAADAITASHDQPLAKVVALGRELGRSMDEHLPAWTVFLREHSSLSDSDKERVLVLRQSYLDHWRAALTEGIKTGDFRDVDLAFVESVFGVFIYTFVWRPPGATGEHLTAVIMDVLLHGVQTYRCTP
jgi:TetR/AcrR family transcriptional regulator, cholesterol catabolism regulator